MHRRLQWGDFLSVSIYTMEQQIKRRFLIWLHLMRDSFRRRILCILLFCNVATFSAGANFRKMTFPSYQWQYLRPLTSDFSEPQAIDVCIRLVKLSPASGRGRLLQSALPIRMLRSIYPFLPPLFKGWNSTLVWASSGGIRGSLPRRERAWNHRAFEWFVHHGWTADEAWLSSFMVIGLSCLVVCLHLSQSLSHGRCPGRP